MLSGKSFVINLKRRLDRLERFTKFYNTDGPDLPLVVFEAIDGSNQIDFDRIPTELLQLISENNDFKNSDTIKAIAWSHMIIWKMIADGPDDYGMIYEDDCFFRECNKLLPDISAKNLKKSWSKIIKDFEKNISNTNDILYFGVGDLLPIHTVPPSESILKAQEYSHVIRNPFYTLSYAKPNFKSAYVFPWLGLSSYVVSKNAANYLLNKLNQTPLNRAIDAWIRVNCEQMIYFTIPLFTYIPNYLTDSDNYDPKIKESI